MICNMYAAATEKFLKYINEAIAGEQGKMTHYSVENKLNISFIPGEQSVQRQCNDSDAHWTIQFFHQDKYQYFIRKLPKSFMEPLNYPLKGVHNHRITIGLGLFGISPRVWCHF